ncbi:MAG: hypothetical protein JSR71_11445 [Proteobacteria bacterium]|nr:hypothetical protein [Pseudomonadota bacterium]
MRLDPAALFLLVALLSVMVYGFSKSSATVNQEEFPVLALTGSYGNGLCIHPLNC